MKRIVIGLSIFVVMLLLSACEPLASQTEETFVAPDMGTADKLISTGLATGVPADAAAAKTLFVNTLSTIRQDAQNGPAAKAISMSGTTSRSVNWLQDGSDGKGKASMTGSVQMAVSGRDTSWFSVGTINNYLAQNLRSEVRAALTERVLSNGMVVSGNLMQKLDFGLKSDLAVRAVDAATGARTNYSNIWTYHAYAAEGFALAVKTDAGQGAKFIVSGAAMKGPGSKTVDNSDSTSSLTSEIQIMLHVAVYNYNDNTPLPALEFDYEVTPLLNTMVL